MADISKITIPGGDSYNLKDNSAIASITKTSTGLSYTTRAGDKTSLDNIGSSSENVMTILSLDDSSLGIMTNGSIEIVNTVATLSIDNTIAYSAETALFKVIMGHLDAEMDSDQTSLILTVA